MINSYIEEAALLMQCVDATVHICIAAECSSTIFYLHGEKKSVPASAKRNDNLITVLWYHYQGIMILRSRYHN
jgi:hypothetical protein